MTAEATLAIIGVALGIGSFFGAGAALWWRDRVPRNLRGLIRHIYPFLDDRLGATKTENLNRADKRFRVIHPRRDRWYLWLLPKKARRALADYIWPVPQIGTGSAAKPPVERMATYFKLEFGPPVPPKGRSERLLARFGVRPYRRWNIEAIKVWPSPEVASRAAQYPTSLIPWITAALGLGDPDEIAIDPDPKETLLKGGYIRYTRKKPVLDDLPDRPPMDVRVDA